MPNQNVTPSCIQAHTSTLAPLVLITITLVLMGESPWALRQAFGPPAIPCPQSPPARRNASSPGLASGASISDSLQPLAHSATSSSRPAPLGSACNPLDAIWWPPSQLHPSSANVRSSPSALLFLPSSRLRASSPCQHNSVTFNPKSERQFTSPALLDFRLLLPSDSIFRKAFLEPDLDSLPLEI